MRINSFFIGVFYINKGIIMSKYYLCLAKEFISEFEFDSKFLVKSGNIEEDFTRILTDYRGGGEEDAVLNGLWSDDIFISFGKSYYSEIPEQDFNVLAKYLAVLS